MNERHIRVFLVDDHEVVREGLKRMLGRSPDIEVVGTAGTGEDAIRAVPLAAPDLVLLDLRLPGMPGLDVLRELKQAAGPPRVLVLTVHDDEELVLDAVRSGADGYVLKHASKQELLMAIRRVDEGGHYFDEAALKALIRGDSHAGVEYDLTPREVEVLRLLSDGFSNKEIGQKLCLSPDTVKTHLGNLYRKLGVEGRAHAVAVALRSRLLK